MKIYSFANNVFAGLALAITGAVTFHVLNVLLPGVIALKFAISAATVFYIVFLVIAADIRAGRFTFPLLTTGMLAIAYLANLSLPAYVAAHVFALWLMRAIYLHRPLKACIDLAGSVGGVILAAWAILQTHSLFVSLWVFFLSQAVMLSLVLSPVRKKACGKSRAADEKFSRALRTAEAAFKRLHNV